MLDIIIKNGTVIDGTGEAARVADIGITGDTVTVIDTLETATAKKMIDATGQIVCPGFIDTHVHSDVMLLHDRQHAAALLQGITTEVLAQDGLSYAPLSQEKLGLYREYLASLNGNPNIAWDWSTVAEFRAKFHHVAVNTVYMLPHGTLRLEAVGFRDVPLYGADLEHVRAMIRQGFAEGAVAFSTGLSYYPASYSDTDEVVELCKTVADCGGFYVTHLRTVFRAEPFDAVAEAIEIGERSSAPVHFSHFRTGPTNLGQTERLVEKLEQAQSRGHDVTAELYPYPGGNTTGLIFFPLWSHEGGPEMILKRLAHPATRRRIARDLDRTLGAWSRIRLSYLASGDRNKLGRTIAELADENNMTGEEYLCTLMLGEKLQVGFVEVAPTDAAVWKAFDKDILALLNKPYYMVGSDSIPVGQKPHPRAYGTFPRLLRLQRENPTSMRIETLINRLTCNAAKRFNLKDRGVLEKGKAADVVVFDPKTVTDKASYDAPNLYAEGISHVLVNGKVAVAQGQVTGELSGRPLP